MVDILVESWNRHWISYPIYRYVVLPCIKVCKNIPQGAPTARYVAVHAPAVAGLSGKYFSGSNESTPSNLALNGEEARRFWNFSDELTVEKAHGGFSSLNHWVPNIVSGVWPIARNLRVKTGGDLGITEKVLSYSYDFNFFNFVYWDLIKFPHIMYFHILWILCFSPLSKFFSSVPGLKYVQANGVRLW